MSKNSSPIDDWTILCGAHHAIIWLKGIRLAKSNLLLSPLLMLNSLVAIRAPPGRALYEVGKVVDKPILEVPRNLLGFIKELSSNERLFFFGLYMGLYVFIYLVI